MAELRYTGLSEITIGPDDTLSVIAEGLIGPVRTEINLSTHRVFDAEGIFLSPSSNRVTLYRERDGRYLFIMQGYRSEEIIKVLSEGPDEEKSEVVLERLCVLSLFGDC